MCRQISHDLSSHQCSSDHQAERHGFTISHVSSNVNEVLQFRNRRLASLCKHAASAVSCGITPPLAVLPNQDAVANGKSLSCVRS
jgi:hypothetical protein